MFILAMIIYVIMGFISGPFWPLELIRGRGGWFGRIVVIAWVILFIYGVTS
jgi:hypothetical protein